MEKRLFADSFAKLPEILFPEENSYNIEILNSFRERIRTYIKNNQWTSHQAWLYPTVCAQYGWKCITSQMLQCEACYSNLSPATPNPANLVVYKMCVKNTLEKLKTCHNKYCPWPTNPCPDEFVRMHSMHKNYAFKVFTKNLKSLYPLKEKLPIIKYETANKLGLSDEICSLLCKLSFVMENSYSSSAIILAATGWSKDLECRSDEKLICLNCQRSVTLLLYNSIASKTQEDIVPFNGENKFVADNENSIKLNETVTLIPEKDNNENTPPLKKRRLSFSKVYFDPLYEHRSWCPWLLSSSENSSDVHSIPGWQLFINCLLRNIKSNEKTSDTEKKSIKDQLKFAKHLIESWNSPCDTK